MQPPKPPPPPKKSATGSSAAMSAVSSGAMRAVPPPLPPAGSSVLPWICLGLSLAVFGIVAVAIVWRVTSAPGTSEDLASSLPSSAELAAGSVGKTVSQPGSVAGGDATVDSNNLAGPTTQAPVNRTTGLLMQDADSKVADVPSEPASNSVLPTTRPVVEKTPVADELPAAFADLRRRKFELELPGHGVIRDATETKLASVPIPAGEALQLAVSGDAAAGFKLVRSTDAGDGTSEWSVLKQARDAFGGQEQVTVGKFLHREGELRFQWNPGAPAWSKPGSLQFARLDLTVGKQSQACQMWRPIVVNPARINTQAATTAEIPLPGDFMDRPQAFRVQFQLAGTAQSDLPFAVVAVGETAKITIGDSEANGVEAELKVTPGDSRSSLQVRLFASPPVAGKDGEVRHVRQEISPAIVQNHVRLGRAKDPKKREGEIDKFQKQVASLQKQVATREDALQQSTFTARGRYQVEITSLNQQIEAIETKIGKLEADLTAMQDLSEKNAVWCEEVGGILKNLDDSAQLRYAVYLDTVPRTVVIETSGFVWKKE